MLSYQWLRDFHLRSHLLKLLKRLLELFTSGWVLSTGSDQLDRVKLGLVVQVVQQLDDLVELVQIVDLNFAFLELGKGGEGAHSTGTDLVDLVGQHVAERRD